MKTYRTINVELRIDVTKDVDRVLQPEVDYAMDYARLVVGRSPMGVWLDVPFSLCDFGTRGPAQVRFHAHDSDYAG